VNNDVVIFLVYADKGTEPRMKIGFFGKAPGARKSFSLFRRKSEKAEGRVKELHHQLSRYLPTKSEGRKNQNAEANSTSRVTKRRTERLFAACPKRNMAKKDHRVLHPKKGVDVEDISPKP